ncbi:hypothetical protein VNO77_39675 [Canavalia gladiata]|uniref:RING-type domain-containing protein n=1 Tax=Canavalia gladiata TaxID=3824 RepID=A0AAN9K0L8_CANGL
MLTKHLTLIYSHLKWVLHFLLYYPFFKLHHSHQQQPMNNIGQEFNTSHYEFTSDSEEHEDCAVCLHKIGGEDEIRVLRCHHVFHRACLDRWVGFKNATCPLCREPVTPRRTLTQFGAEVLFFQFCSTRNDYRDTWWLR